MRNFNGIIMRLSAEWGCSTHVKKMSSPSEAPLLCNHCKMKQKKKSFEKKAFKFGTPLLDCLALAWRFRLSNFNFFRDCINIWDYAFK